jgi:UDP-N-acetylglucosamine 2-epimerase (non-hydrolysing)
LKVAIVLGTRPEIIKMGPIIRECENQNLDYFVLHSGQHYSYEMDKVFFEQLGLPDVRYNLNVGSGTHGEQTGKILVSTERVLEREEPDVVLVEGDTNTVLAGALAAAKLKIPVGHIEAGLRSYDRSMPEEINRVIADHLSDFLFAPTEYSKKLLLKEGVPEGKIFVTGNTIVDSIYQNLEFSKSKSDILDKFGLESGKYFLVTMHRQENVDCQERLVDVANSLSMIKDEFGSDLIYSVHPRTKKCFMHFGICLDGVKCIDPLDYLSFLNLLYHARLVLTDSGGVQEEACIMKVPCVTLRDNTERPETLEVGSNVLAGTNPERILEMIKKMMNISNSWINPFGDGSAGKKIVDILKCEF